jgi:hypothetical protein
MDLKVDLKVDRKFMHLDPLIPARRLLAQAPPLLLNFTVLALKFTVLDHKPVTDLDLKVDLN